MLHLDKLFGPGHPLVDSLEEDPKDVVGELDLTLLNLIVEQQPLLFEGVDIRLQEIDLHRIEGLQVHIENSRGNLVVQPVLRQVLSLDELRDRYGDVPVKRRRAHRICRDPKPGPRKENARQDEQGKPISTC